jgi:3-hydroxy-5-methyl-1-naphthoate 3-O-methyltransferase
LLACLDLMSDLTEAPLTDPTPLYRSRDELYAEDMLIAALRGFDFFTWLDAHPGTVTDIASHFGFHERPVDVMTTLFVAQGLLERSGPRLQLSTLGREHLVATSPWFIGPYFPQVTDRPIALDLIEILRTDRPSHFASRKDTPDWHKAMETQAIAQEFTAAMDCRGRLLGQALARNLDLAPNRRVLDVAGGSGIYACALAARFPHLRASVLEKPPVDAIASRAIDARGLRDRVDVLTGDMLADPWPPGYDIHLLSNVLHDWDVPIVLRLLEASARALPAGGTLIVHDAFLNEDKTGPLPLAAYSVLLMHVTQGRCYSLDEMSTFLRKSGFASPRQVTSAAGRSALVACVS